jgi:transposase-like protein
MLGRRVVHRTSAYRNNGLEQDHRVTSTEVVEIPTPVGRWG